MIVTFLVGQGGLSFAADFASLDDLRLRDKAAFQEIVIKTFSKAVHEDKISINLSFDIE